MYNVLMLLFREHFIGLTVASVQSGLPCGKVTGFVIDPSNLAIGLIIVANTQAVHYLLPSDVRFFNHERLIIDAEEKLSSHEDLVRHQEAIDAAFDPIGCKVVTESNKRLGKVVNYAIEDSNWLIGKLYVASGLLGNPLQQEHMIDRTDITNVDKNRITVRDLKSKATKPLTIPLPKHTL